MYDGGIMSITWGMLQSDKKSIFLGSVYWGVGVLFLIGAPLLLLLNYYGYGVSIWIGILLVLVVFPISTYCFYKAGCKKLTK